MTQLPNNSTPKQPDQRPLRVAIWTAVSSRQQATEDKVSLDPSDRIDIEDLKEVMNGAILRLPPRERLVIALYYYEELTLKEIGSILNVSESRISQIHTKAIVRLRGKLRSQMKSLIAGLMGPGIGNLVLALTLVGWVGYARLARAQVLSVKGREHVVAARALGTPAPRIVLRHLLPLISSPLLVEATFGVAAVVIAESGLSFLGLGVQPPEASWGSMIRDGVRYLLVAPHLVLVPGTALFLVVLSVNMLGDRLRDRLDVRSLRYGVIRGS